MKAGEISAVTAAIEFDEPALGADNPTAGKRLTARVTSPLNQGVSVSQTVWQKKDESGEWKRYYGAEFAEGEYRLWGQLRSDYFRDGTNTYYALTADSTLTINGEAWESTSGLADYYEKNGYGYKWYASKVFTVHFHSFGNWSVAKPTKTIKRLMKGKYYYVKTRAYKKVGTTYYGHDPRTSSARR